jgi:hypothetical protein
MQVRGCPYTVGGTTAEVAVTCGGCLAPHWLTVRRRLAQ